MAVHVNGRVVRDGVASGDRRRARTRDLRGCRTGARRDASTGAHAGTFGRWAAFSFYPSKTLGCFGDAGALVTNDDEIAATVRAMRNHGAGADKGISPDCAMWGTNARLDNIQPAILAYKLTGTAR